MFVLMFYVKVINDFMEVGMLSNDCKSCKICNKIYISTKLLTDL